MSGADVAFEANISEEARLAKLGAGTHCTVLRGDCVTPQKVSAAKSHFSRYQEEYGHLEQMQELDELLKLHLQN